MKSFIGPKFKNSKIQKTNDQCKHGDTTKSTITIQNYLIALDYQQNMKITLL